MRRPQPLRRVRSIKLKIAFLIVVATATAAVVSQVGVKLDWPLWLRPLVAGAISLLLVEFLAHGLTSPLREMERASTRMAKGDYGVRVDESSADEVGRLARAFNAMAGELALIERQRRDVVANASHELRGPISALQATLEHLIDGVLPSTPVTLAAMHGQVERIGRLVHDLLDLSRFEAGTAPLHLAPVAVVDLAHNVVEDVHDELPGLHVDIVATNPGLKLQGDADRLAQVLTTVVTRAARYSSRAVITIDERDERDDTSVRNVRIVVSDDGPGIPSGEEGRIFARFYRADLAKQSGEAGLGLVIARWIVDLHGGTIHAEQNEPHGSRVIIDLPLRSG
jgi:signal transduction histidine kinase